MFQKIKNRVYGMCTFLGMGFVFQLAVLKAPLHCAIFRKACLTKPWRDGLNETFPICKVQVVETVAESRIEFYFLHCFAQRIL